MVREKLVKQVGQSLHPKSYQMNGQAKLIREFYHPMSISNGNWNVLDMFDIKGLAEKLTDDDVYAILVCIDAKHKLKKACLSKCTKLVGNGLEPLRGSVVLEHITAGDQSYYYPSPSNRNKPLVLSHSVVIPILDSIVSTVGTHYVNCHFLNVGMLMILEMNNHYLDFLQSSTKLCSQRKSSV